MANVRAAAVFGVATSVALVAAYPTITNDGLPVANVADGFGPEDKMVACRSKLVFIDLDLNGGTYFWIDTATWNLTTGPITMDNTTGTDRILLVGGDANETNIYYSNNCGQSWMCMEDPELWSPRDYATIIPTTGVLPGNPVMLAGGRSFESRDYNRDMFMSTDGGMTWARPACPDPTNCARGCAYGCTLTVPDPNGTCSAANPDYEACYTLPDFPVYPGGLATDWDTLWMFMGNDDDGDTWVLNASTYQTAWTLSPGRYGGFGRKVFIKGTIPGSGCWFSTDYQAVDLWIRPADFANSMAGFMTAPTGDGPWTDWTTNFPVPWAARASAAVTSAPTMTGAWFASGMAFSAGTPSNPTFADAWQIDAGVCLISPTNNQICSGLVEPNLDSVSCSCPRASDGDPFCGSCTAGVAYGAWPNCTMCPTHGGAPGAQPCGAGNGRGRCDPTDGCVCFNGFSQPQTGCDGCAPGFWGSLCGVCPVCGPNGACDGSGTTGGSGTCKCNTGWTGNQCDTCAPGYYGPSCTPCPACNNGVCDGSGTTGGAGTCTCNAGWFGVSCSTCSAGFWGPTCSACPSCGAHGFCVGSGTTGGTGVCKCSSGWSGNDCSTQGGVAPAPAPAPSAAPSGPLAGDIAAGVMGGVIGFVLIGGFVFVRFFRGGPAVARALRGVASLAEAGSGAKAVETQSILKAAQGAPRMSDSAAAARLGGGSAAYSTIGN